MYGHVKTSLTRKQAYDMRSYIYTLAGAASSLAPAMQLTYARTLDGPDDRTGRLKVVFSEGHQQVAAENGPLAVEFLHAHKNEFSTLLTYILVSCIHATSTAVRWAQRLVLQVH
jgi:hypothetical protein